MRTADLLEGSVEEAQIPTTGPLQTKDALVAAPGGPITIQKQNQGGPESMGSKISDTRKKMTDIADKAQQQWLADYKFKTSISRPGNKEDLPTNPDQASSVNIGYVPPEYIYGPSAPPPAPLPAQPGPNDLYYYYQQGQPHISPQSYYLQACYPPEGLTPMPSLPPPDSHLSAFPY